MYNSAGMWVLSAVVSILITWVVFTLLVLWCKPNFYNADGSPNWWTSLWIIVVSVIIAWLVLAIVAFLLDPRRKAGVKQCCN